MDGDVAHVRPACLLTARYNTRACTGPGTLPGTAWSSTSAACDARLRPQDTDQPRQSPVHLLEPPACTRAALNHHPLFCLTGAWQGLGAACAGALPLAPDLGPTRADPHMGVCTVGAAPLVVNFNIPIMVRRRSLLRE